MLFVPRGVAMEPALAHSGAQRGQLSVVTAHRLEEGKDACHSASRPRPRPQALGLAGSQDHPALSSVRPPGWAELGNGPFLSFNNKTNVYWAFALSRGLGAFRVRTSTSQQPQEEGPVLSPIAQRKRLRRREGKAFARGHTARKWWSWNCKGPCS